MLSQRAKDLFAKLELYEPVALKYEAVRPVGIKQHPGHYAFCEYVRESIDNKRNILYYSR